MGTARDSRRVGQAAVRAKMVPELTLYHQWNLGGARSADSLSKATKVFGQLAWRRTRDANVSPNVTQNVLTSTESGARSEQSGEERRRTKMLDAVSPCQLEQRQPPHALCVLWRGFTFQKTRQCPPMESRTKTCCKRSLSPRSTSPPRRGMPFQSPARRSSFY